MSTNPPQIEVTIAAPVDAVWAALRDREKIHHWHGWEYDGLAEEINDIFFTGHTEDADARTLEVQGGDLFTVEPEGQGTRLTVTRAAPSGDPEWDPYYDDISEGWITFVNQLRFFLERQSGATRRTLFYSGDATRTGPVTTELELAEVAGRHAGTRFATSLVGEDVKGEVWFRSDHQLGVTVDGWGDGLLVVAYTEPAPTKPNGAAMAVLSTYGLDDARLADLNDRWTGWWARRYADRS